MLLPMLHFPPHFSSLSEFLRQRTRVGDAWRSADCLVSDDTATCDGCFSFFFLSEVLREREPMVSYYLFCPDTTSFSQPVDAPLPSCREGDWRRVVPFLSRNALSRSVMTEGKKSGARVHVPEIQVTVPHF